MPDILIDLTPTVCPYCKDRHIGSVGVQGRRPKPGSFSICQRCGRWSIFGSDMTLHAPSWREKQIINRSGVAKFLRKACEAATSRRGNVN